MPITFEYALTDGRTVSRYYYVWMGDENGEYLRSLFSSALCVFGYEENVDLFLVGNGSVVVQDTYEGVEKTIYSDGELRSLYEAILADCEAGTMAQDWDFHPNESNVYWLNFQSGLSLMVFTDSENTLQWLRDHGFNVDAAENM